MKTIGPSLSDLREFGIDVLTGEACAYSARLLCDLDEQGQRIFTDCLGLPFGTQFQSGWNDSKKVSVMIPPDLFGPLMAWALIKTGHDIVIERNDGSFTGMRQWEADGPPQLGLAADDEYNAPANRLEEVCRVYRGMDQVRRLYRKMAGQPSVGTRHAHSMSGRVI